MVANKRCSCSSGRARVRPDALDGCSHSSTMLFQAIWTLPSLRGARPSTFLALGHLTRKISATLSRAMLASIKEVPWEVSLWSLVAGGLIYSMTIRGAGHLAMMRKADQQSTPGSSTPPWRRAMLLAAVANDWLREWGPFLIMVAGIGAAMIWPRTTILAVAIIMCVAALGLREFGIVAVARGMIRDRQASHTWTQEYSEGILDLRSYTTATSK